MGITGVPAARGRRSGRAGVLFVLGAVTAVVTACQPTGVPGAASPPGEGSAAGPPPAATATATAPDATPPGTPSGAAPAVPAAPDASATVPASSPAGSPVGSPVTSPSAPASAAPPRGTLMGVNDGSGYDTSPEHIARWTAEVSRLGLDVVRMGMDDMGCEREGEECDFSRRDPAVSARTAAGIGIHAVVSFRGHVSAEGGREQWARNFAWKCGEIAEHYRDEIRYYIVDNEPDIDYGGGQRAKAAPDLVVDMQRACYDAVKAVDPGIRVESSPATSPGTGYNRDLLAAGIGDHADVIGTHMYGGQLERDEIDVLRGYMAEHGVDKPIAVSEAGVSLEWFGPDTPYQGLTGPAARAEWLRDFAAYARAEGLDNVLFFSVGSTHGCETWEICEEAGLQALADIGRAG